MNSIWSRISRRLTIALGREPPPVMTADLLPQYKIGPGTYGVPQIIQYPNDASLEIGAYCSIAAEVSIFLGGEHHPEWVSTYPFGALWREHQHPDHPRSRGNVLIGNDVWIGRGATIMSGIRVGDGAVIGARALVVKDVPPYAIVGGNPAKVIRQRFDSDVVEAMLAVRWWEWPEARIRRAAPMLQSPDVRAFIAAVEQGRL